MNCIKTKSSHIITLFRVFGFSLLPPEKCPSYSSQSKGSLWFVFFLSLCLFIPSMFVFWSATKSDCLHICSCTLVPHLHEFARMFSLFGLPQAWVLLQVLPWFSSDQIRSVAQSCPLFDSPRSPQNQGIVSPSFILPSNLYHGTLSSVVYLCRNSPISHQRAISAFSHTYGYFQKLELYLIYKRHSVTMWWVTESIKKV